MKTVDLVLAFGRPMKKPGGTREYRIRKRDVEKYIGNLKSAMHSLEKARNKAALLSGDEDILITVYICK